MFVKDVQSDSRECRTVWLGRPETTHVASLSAAHVMKPMRLRLQSPLAAADDVSGSSVGIAEEMTGMGQQWVSAVLLAVVGKICWLAHQNVSFSMQVPLPTPQHRSPVCPQQGQWGCSGDVGRNEIHQAKQFHVGVYLRWGKV